MNAGAMELNRTSPESAGALHTLRAFVRPRRADAQTCELCARRIDTAHPHLLELERRRIVCACEACAILFSGAAAGRYRRLPRDARRLQGFELEDATWDSLLIPIQLAFFFFNSVSGRIVAQYPGPAGAMTSSLELEAWTSIVDANPILNSLEPDVEALLAHRVAAPAQYYLAPIDRCYELVGILRTGWRGLSGGSEVWTAIDQFFQRLREHSREVPHA